eukprot:CAMPEP_0201602666 /NCGR_PEP_ID=MMETSP0492-20130828/3323_1 /ASSEMBLY_ACC=CAM_ASM_000837 /TAXON_ID=420259 /ORGANISM="Thalassiosira gravida, Strain GMp14c1" /LENGTH=72 /DNA_ID=CAMNT_0048066233 /DNA_START=180 /DNA_END=398 /DNA_ORIENTATION=+
MECLCCCFKKNREIEKEDNLEHLIGQTGQGTGEVASRNAKPKRKKDKDSDSDSIGDDSMSTIGVNALYVPLM